MKVAHIVPPPWAGTFPRSNYMMVLAHWVLKYPDYAKQIRSGRAYVFMDNGAFEGVQLSYPQLNEAAATVGADEIILQDVLGEAGETLRRSREGLGQLTVKRVMFVVQARTHEEWQRCLETWLKYWDASPWKGDYHLSFGVSSLREATGTALQIGTRTALMTKVAETGFPVHLLGMRDIEGFVTKELPVVKSLGVRGIDTSAAFSLATKGVLLTPGAQRGFLGDPSQYKMLTTRVRRLVFLNTTILNDWIDTGVATKGVPTRLIRQVASRWLKYWAEGFGELSMAMRACGMPAGQYALLKEGGREKYVRPFWRSETLTDEEELIEMH